MTTDAPTGDVTPMQGGSARFLGALSAFLAIAVGGPSALVALGRWRFGGWSPLHGSSVPSIREWRDAWNEPLGESTIVDLVVRIGLAVGWLAVAVIVWSVVTEVIHLIRFDGISAPDVRLLGPSQRLGRLIASGLLVVIPVVGSGRTMAVGTVPLVPVPTTTAAASVEAVLSAADPDRADPDRADPDRADLDPSGPSVHVVVAGESIHSIAERFAGSDPRAVVDYADRILELNLGRTMPDGQMFVNAAFIDVGWVLELPVDESVDAAGDYVVARGDSLWSIADEHLGAGSRWTEIFHANRGRTFDDGRSLDDPDLILPGWQMEIPDAGRSVVDQSVVDQSVVDVPVVDQSVVDVPVVDVPVVDQSVVDQSVVDVPATEQPDAEPDVPVENTPATVPAVVEVAPPPPTVVTDVDVVEPRQRNRWLDDPGQPAVELLTVNRAAMLSAGVLALVASRRRRRLRESGPHAVSCRPPEPIVALERRLRSGDPGDLTVRLDLGIRCAAPALVAGGARVVAVFVDRSGDLELVSSAPAAPSRPWEPGDGPTRWRLAASVRGEALAGAGGGAGAPCPTLVQIGVADDGRDLYVDLEALGTLEVSAPEPVARSVVTALAAALAAAPAAESVTLLDVGIGDDAFLGHRYHRAVPDVETALREADDVVAVPVEAGRSTFELRSLATGEQWEPTVVFLGAPSHDGVPAAHRPGLAVVSAGSCVEPSARLVAHGHGWRLDPVGIGCTPVGLSSAEARSLAVLAREADAPFDDSTLPPEHDGAPVVVRSSRPDLLVRLLGPVSVRSADGRLVEFDRQKSKELVVWLATHRERSTRTAARTALWELDVRDATFANVVSDARRSLARLVPVPDGDEWIGRTLGEDLPLHPAVRTDADLVREALTAMRHDPGDASMAVLREAVDLIVGTPFEGTDYLWPEAEGIASELVLLATSATTRLAEWCLDAGDVDGLFEVTARGLQVLPGHEAMVGLRMRAFAAVGDRAGVRREWAQYERVHHADPWSDGEPSPVLAGLRRQLLDS